MAEEYASNSHRSKERQVESVVTSPVRQRKKGMLANLFLREDVESMKNYILQDVLIPMLRRAGNEILCGISNAIFGDSGKRNNGIQVSYRQQGSTNVNYNRPRSAAPYTYNDIIFDNRADAEEVLFRMEEILSQFETVSVADMFDLAGISSDYTSGKYGWTNLSTAYVERVRDGYVIRLPRAGVL